MKKIKILMLGDNPLWPSGVGTQLGYITKALLATGKFQIRALAGAQKHADYRPSNTDLYGDDLIIFPVDGYGTQEIVRSHLRAFRPDIVFFMTDPRYWGWLWQIENEIRPLAPMVYYHVWDNYPIPKYNSSFYKSNDVICTISKLTQDIVSQVAPEVENHYIPHAVDPKIFKPLLSESVDNFWKNVLEPGGMDRSKFHFFFNSRNARRKQSGSLIYWFKEFLDDVGHDKATLFMHTNPKDQHGPDLHALIKDFGVNKGQVIFSPQKLPPEHMALLYNCMDCTVLLSDAEGFGLSGIESLSCGTPAITTRTGGMQDYMIAEDGTVFGHCLEPTSKAIVGTQETPYIFEDRLDASTVIPAMKSMLEMDKDDRKALGASAAAHIRENFGFAEFEKKWVDLLLDVHEKHSSWPTKNYKKWELIEI